VAALGMMNAGEVRVPSFPFLHEPWNSSRSCKRPRGDFETFNPNPHAKLLRKARRELWSMKIRLGSLSDELVIHEVLLGCRLIDVPEYGNLFNDENTDHNAREEAEITVKMIREGKRSGSKIRVEFHSEDKAVQNALQSIMDDLDPDELKSNKVQECLANGLESLLWESLGFHSIGYEKCTKKVHLDLVPGSTEWRKVVQSFEHEHFNKTMHRPRQIQKVHNPFLFRRYMSYMETMKFNDAFVQFNERYMFHGTSKNKPEGITLGNAGFDPRVCKDSNKIGRSVHFSLRADASARGYRHEVENCPYGSQQIILARVLCGNICQTKSFANRVRPPPMPNTDGRQLYDSVMFKGRNYMQVPNVCFVGIFDAHQAFPDYLITFESKDEYEPAMV